jgi:inner membrane protein
MHILDKNRLLIKGLLIGGLILLMLIPAAIINQRVIERKARQSEVIAEVSSSWAGAQTVGGPVLVVPYIYTYEGPDKKPITTRKLAHILPETLRISGSIDPELRKRSLYEVMLYASRLRLSGTFSPAPLDRLGLQGSQLIWSEARLLVGLSDPAGLLDDVGLSWNGARSIMEPGVPENGALREGLSAPVALQEGGGASFDIQLAFRGTEHLHFLPLGRNTDVSLSSPWKHPSFEGKYLPASRARTDTQGIEASWKVLSAGRGFPQAWKDNDVNLTQSAFGVRLIQPVDTYVKTERSVKYAILFIALSFIIFFFLEILQKRRVHPLQYLLVGFALCIFYTLLLSISEYAGFNNAYIIATLATVGLVGMYTKSLFHSWKTALGFSLALGGLYAYIFILIQLEDYALLFGSIGLFIILAVLMYFSRRIDWYSDAPGEPDPSQLSPLPVTPTSGAEPSAP